MNEFHCRHLPYTETAQFSKIVLDYLEQKPELRPLFQFEPHWEGMQSQALSRQSFAEADRALLVEVLLEQNRDLPNNQLVLSHIEALRSSHTFTITTGHQLCVFTGPLYFLYKVAHVIKLCAEAKTRWPHLHCIPVFWMASEDHDFEEVNHVNVSGQKLKWNKIAKGAVGRLDLEGLEALIEDLSKHIGNGKRQNELITLFKEAYQGSQNLSQATRKLVHALFGQEGLVIIDPDDKRLKGLMVNIFEKELVDQAAFKASAPVQGLLNARYGQQALIRPINLFYLDQSRERLEATPNGFTTTGQNAKTWTQAQLLEELRQQPERFSPNVILRPLYQERILPNLAYVGGGGELAYWLQLKGIFDFFEVPYPILVLRNSFMFTEAFAEKTKQKLQLIDADLFQKPEQVLNRFIEEHSTEDLHLLEAKTALDGLYQKLMAEALRLQNGMPGAVEAEFKRQNRGLDRLRKKLFKAEKRKHQDRLESLEKLHKSLFPNGVLQERHANFTDFYLLYGSGFLEAIHQYSRHLDSAFCIISPKYD